ncbi:type VI secretion protein [Halomonas sp. 7T]|uniref:type VI secretion protein n=1 Tax=Halomonas sp. 7T TaxID=2893469 RepID=UPI0021DA7CC2|nr:type VI secretion protein [Halomonas sp. 7T]UXZ55808.1 type VI secretion protein [Halomonas sp. 7T]
MQKIATYVATTFALLIGQAHASEACTDISNDQRRLACYDAEYRPAIERENVSEWNVSEQTSPIDDSKTVVLRTTAIEAIAGRFGRDSRPNLILRCHENKTVMYFGFEQHHMADIQGYGRVTLRVDQQNAVTRNMKASTDSKALGLWNGGQSIPVIRSMFDGDVLTVRATPFSESPITVQFPIAGLEEAISPLREACNW